MIYFAPNPIFTMNILIIMKLHDLIKAGQTGSPQQLAEKLGISQRSLHYYIVFMKTRMNADIEYDKKKDTYFYSKECKLCFIN